MSQRTVLLYSGGVDSYATAVLLRPNILLHVDMGTEYGRRETENLPVPPDRTVTHVDLPLVRWERPDSVIPGRNAHLVLVGAHYGDIVYLAATSGDRLLDKSRLFAHRMNLLLEHMYAPQWWLPGGRHVEVQLPVKHLTKRRLVAEYLEVGGDPQVLARDTLSCYGTPEDATHCGRCKACARKWVALTCNGIDPGYDASPFVRETYVPDIEAGRFEREDEARDILDALSVTT